MEEHTKYLLDRVRLLKDCRFIAYRRLESARTKYQLVLTACTVGLIFLPLVDELHIKELFGFHLNEPLDETVVNFFSITLAIIILVYSLLIDSLNFAVRAERFLCCSRELDHLYREAKELVANNEQNAFNTINKKLEEVLGRYENHENIDFLRAKLLGKSRRACLYVAIGIRWFWENLPVFLILGLESLTFYWLLFRQA